MSANISRVPIKLKDLKDSFNNHVPIRSFFKSIKSKWVQRVSIDSYMFSLHSTITVSMLIFFMSFLTMKQYFGEIIECLDIASAPQSLSSKQMTNYCWMEGAFTIVTRFYEDARGQNMHDITGQDTAYPGIKAYKPHQGDLKMPHKYYQWVYYILGIQCFLFYAPKLFWRLRERGRLTHLIKQLQDKIYVQLLVNYEHQQPLLQAREPRQIENQPNQQPPPPGFNKHPQNTHNDALEVIQDTADTILIADQYYGGIIIAELFYFLHLMGEMIFIHLFLGGKFFFLGFQWLYYTSLSDDITFDPLIRIFPRLTKCSFHKFGASGSLETYDTLCFMPMNIVNEKIFTILWFWFVLLLFFTLCQLVDRLICHLSSVHRLERLRQLAPCADPTNSTKNEVDFLKDMSNNSPGRSFILRLIAQNLKPNYFRYYIEQTSKHFKKKEKEKKGTYEYSSKLPLGLIPSAPPMEIVE